MGLYNCEKCGVMENTALSMYWSRNSDIIPIDYRGKRLCSECSPKLFSDGTVTGYGKWHGRFEKCYDKVKDTGSI